MSLIKVKDNNHLYRDEISGAIINLDYNGLEEYNKKRKLMASRTDEINTLKCEMQNIKDDISEIKQLMLRLMDKG